MIKAECHSDDRCIEVNFDAIPWFEDSSDDKILSLIRCGWGYDYPADDIAHYMADQHEGVKRMFDYLDMRGKIETIGFECSVDETTATLWLEINRPGLLLKV
jgi:hypothetical protein